MAADLFPALNLPKIKFQDPAYEVFKIKAGAKKFLHMHWLIHGGMKAKLDSIKPKKFDKVIRLSLIHI